MGNCWELSRRNPQRTIVNFDIGGGTTNIALGRNGEVLQTGSYFVGARHVQLEPGTYRIAGLSKYAVALLEHLGIHKAIGERLSEGEVLAIVDWYLDLLETLISRTGTHEADTLTALHREAPFDPPTTIDEIAITLSGGVGQLAYRGLRDGAWPTTTAYGDLGIDLAKRLVERPFWRSHLTRFVPTGLGRATLFGLLRYSTQVSGNTLFLSDPRLLPLKDLVILGAVSPVTSQADVDRLLALVGRTSEGACLRIEAGPGDRNSIRELAQKLRGAISRETALADIPLILLVRENLGKALGQLVTNWGSTRAKVIVIDEIDAGEAQFAHIGRLNQGVVPVSFHGMNASGESS
jgi:ethanolamine utilization protein EutA